MTLNEAQIAFMLEVRNTHFTRDITAAEWLSCIGLSPCYIDIANDTVPFLFLTTKGHALLDGRIEA